MDTPPPVSSPPSLPGVSLPRSGLDEMVAKLPGSFVQLYTLYLLSPLLSLPYADPRWIRGLYATLAVAFPALAWNGFLLLRRSLERTGKQP